MRSIYHYFNRFHIYLPILVGICGLYTSCKFNPNVQGEGEPYLQGVWEQDSIANQDKRLSYSLYKFKFTCDSVYITLNTHSKVRTVVDSCFDNGHWTEYARGVYLVRNDSLLIESTFTRENWRQKLSGCHRIGQFLPRFKIIQHGSDSLRLESQYYQTEVKLKKVEDIVCVPKPI